jgi:hypothetical protein
LRPSEIVLLGSKAEKSLAKRFLELPGPKLDKVVDLTGRTDLANLSAVLRRLNLFVSADTGVLHLAAALGAPIAAVFGGPAYAFETGPYSPGALMIQGRRDCSPCSEDNPCPFRLCPALPPAEKAAEAAALILKRDIKPYDISNERESFLIHRAIRGGVGQRLVPAEAASLDDETKLALAVEETVAGLFYDERENALTEDFLNRYRPEAGGAPLDELMGTIYQIAEGLGDDVSLRRRFLFEAPKSLSILEAWEKNQ